MQQNDTDDSVVYNGRFFKATELSQETLDWLEWYNGLSDDLKEMVSHEPLELELASPTPYTTTTTVDATALDIDIPMPLETSLLPTSGYEPVYILIIGIKMKTLDGQIAMLTLWTY